MSTSSEFGDADANPITEQSEQEFIVPTPLSYSDVDEPSLIQYRKEGAMETAKESFDESADMELQEGAEMCEMEEAECSELIVAPCLLSNFRVTPYH